jgi:hypothetical protein
VSLHFTLTAIWIEAETPDEATETVRDCLRPDLLPKGHARGCTVSFPDDVVKDRRFWDDLATFQITKDDLLL